MPHPVPDPFYEPGRPTEAKAQQGWIYMRGSQLTTTRSARRPRSGLFGALPGGGHGCMCAYMQRFSMPWPSLLSFFQKDHAVIYGPIAAGRALPVKSETAERGMLLAGCLLSAAGVGYHPPPLTPPLPWPRALQRCPAQGHAKSSDGADSAGRCLRPFEVAVAFRVESLAGTEEYGVYTQQVRHGQ